MDLLKRSWGVPGAERTLSDAEPALRPFLERRTAHIWDCTSSILAAGAPAYFRIFRVSDKAARVDESACASNDLNTAAEERKMACNSR